MLVPHQLFTFTGGGSVIKESTYASSCSHTVAIRALPHPLCSAFCQPEFTSRTLYTFRRVIYLGSSEDRHDSVSFSFVCTTELTCRHPLPQSHRVNKCTTIPSELIFANRYSFWRKSCLASQGLEIPPQRSAILSTNRMSLMGATAHFSCSYGKEGQSALCKQVLTFAADSLCSGPFSL